MHSSAKVQVARIPSPRDLRARAVHVPQGCRVVQIISFALAMSPIGFYGECGTDTNISFRESLYFAAITVETHSYHQAFVQAIYSEDLTALWFARVQLVAFDLCGAL